MPSVRPIGGIGATFHGNAWGRYPPSRSAGMRSHLHPRRRVWRTKGVRTSGPCRARVDALAPARHRHFQVRKPPARPGPGLEMLPPPALMHILFDQTVIDNHPTGQTRDFLQSFTGNKLACRASAGAIDPDRSDTIACQTRLGMLILARISHKGLHTAWCREWTSEGPGGFRGRSLEGRPRRFPGMGMGPGPRAARRNFQISFEGGLSLGGRQSYTSVAPWSSG